MVKEQVKFAKDFCDLLEYIYCASFFVVTFGEAYRTEDQQRLYVNSGASKTNNSRHLVRMAVDLNFFAREENDRLRLTYDKKELQAIGDYWESLDPKNRWGGNFTNFEDTPHFERGKRDRS